MQVVPYAPFLASWMSRGSEVGAQGLMLGLLFAPYSACAAVFNPAWSALASRFGSTRVASLALALEAFCLFNFGMCQTLPAAVAWRAAQGAASGTWAILQTGLMTTASNDAEVLEAFGYFAATFSAATCVAPLAGGGLYDKRSRFVPAIFGIDKPRPASLACATSALALIAIAIPALVFLRKDDKTGFKALVQEKKDVVELVAAPYGSVDDNKQKRNLVLWKDAKEAAPLSLALSPPGYFQKGKCQRASSASALAETSTTTTTTTTSSSVEVVFTAEATPEKEPPVSSFEATLNLLKNGKYVRCVTLYCLVSIVFMSWEVIFPLWAASQVGFSAQNCGIYAAMGGIVLAIYQCLGYAKICAFCGGPVAYWQRAWLPPLIIFLALPAIVNPGQRHNVSSEIVIAIANVLLSVCLGSCFPTVSVLINQVCRVDETPMANGLAQAAVSVSRALGPTIAAVAFHWSFRNNQEETQQLEGLSVMTQGRDYLLGRALVFLFLAGLAIAAILLSMPLTHS